MLVIAFVILNQHLDPFFFFRNYLLTKHESMVIRRRFLVDIFEYISLKILLLERQG